MKILKHGLHKNLKAHSCSPIDMKVVIHSINFTKKVNKIYGMNWMKQIIKHSFREMWAKISNISVNIDLYLWISLGAVQKTKKKSVYTVPIAWRRGCLEFTIHVVSRALDFSCNLIKDFIFYAAFDSTAPQISILLSHAKTEQ